MSVYVNGMQLHLNEIALIEFKENSQTGDSSVAKIAMLYPTLKEFHKVIGEAIEQYDKKLHELQRTKANMN